MATLLAITVLLPLFGSLVLVLCARARGAHGPADRAGVHAGDAGALADFPPGVPVGSRRRRSSRSASSDGHYGSELDRAPGHPVRPGPRRPLALALFLDLVIDDHGDRGLVAVDHRAGALYYAFLLALQTGLLGLFASLDVVLFYIFFEFTLIPLFFLIGLWGGPQRRRAAVTFFLYTLAGSLLTLLGVIALVAVHYQHSPGNVLTFSIPELTKGLAELPWTEWRNTDSLSSPQV